MKRIVISLLVMFVMAGMNAQNSQIEAAMEQMWEAGERVESLANEILSSYVALGALLQDEIMETSGYDDTSVEEINAKTSAYNALYDEYFKYFEDAKSLTALIAECEELAVTTNYKGKDAFLQAIETAKTVVEAETPEYGPINGNPKAYTNAYSELNEAKAVYLNNSNGSDIKVGESSIVIEQEPRDDYESTDFNVDLTTIANALQCNTSQIELKAKDSEGNYASSTATKGGYWFNQNGSVITFSFGSNDEAFYIEPEEEGNLSKLKIGQYPSRFNGGEEMSATLYFVYESKSYEYKVTLKISKCSTPQITREGTTNIIIMTCHTDGATIYYTTDGSTPTTSSTKYTGQISVSQNVTIKAIAVKSGYTNSDVATFNVDWVTSKVGEFSIVIEQEARDDYESTAFNVDLTTIANALQCDVSQIQLNAKDSEGNYASSTATKGGYWFDPNGFVITFTSGSSNEAFYIEPATEGNLETMNIGQYPSRFNGGEEMSATLYFTYGSNHYEYNVTLKIKSKDNSICATPQISRYNSTSNRVTITCGTEGATIYYTTDGTTPTISSSIYTGSITVSKNCTIQAIAVKEGYENSSVVSYVVDWFGATPDAELEYEDLTTDDLWKWTAADATAQKVQRASDGVLTLNQSTGIVYGTVDGNISHLVYADLTGADVLEMVVATGTPRCIFNRTDANGTTQIELPGNDKYWTINNNNDGSKTYTVDLKRINDDYGFVHLHSIKGANWQEANVRSIKIGYRIGNMGVCDTPQITRYNSTSNRVSITCGTEGATIYYTTNGTTPTENNTRYTGPITVSQNCTVKAIAVKDGYMASEVASFAVNWFKVATPTFNYDNLQLTISTTTNGATIYYTTDGSTPTTSSTKYSGPLSLSEDCTVKAIAVKADFNNSEVATYNFTVGVNTCQAPEISRDGTSNQVVMTCATLGASIYYTIDGSTPSSTSTLYTGPFTINRNRTIRAIAMKTGMFNSALTLYEANWFKVETPIFSFSDRKLTISSATSGAIIYYTTDGSDPADDRSTAIRYTTPISLEIDTEVKSVAVKTGYTTSEMASYKFVRANYVCKKPTIQRDGTTNRLIMSCDVENAAIYYTTDGSIPTEASTRYTGPVTMTYNCSVTAVASRSDLFPSSTTVFNVNWLTASAVQVAYSDGVLTLTCATPGAVIYYEIGGKDATMNSQKYTGPISLTDNREVRYVAYADGYEPVSGSFTPTDFACAPATLTYDGLNIELTTTEKDATIYYTTDGSIPTTLSARYTGKTPLTGLCTVNAFAVTRYKNNSEMMTVPITYFFDGTTVSLSEPGRMDNALKWLGTAGLEELTVQCQGQGVVNSSDFSTIRSIKSLKHLNLQNARFENNTVPEGAFSGMNLVSVEFPPSNTDITMITGDVFSGCKHLAAIVWMAQVKMAQSASALGITNPNLLIYVDNKSYAPQGVRNIVENGSASSIVLTDDGGGFWCPQEFTAQRISYSHAYSQTTGINDCSGWETIVLPFDVQNITHEKAGKIAPFEAKDASARPFWLGELTTSGFRKAAEIKANTPYIISMPNSEEYGDSYILKGEVTFEAFNMMVPVTEVKTVSKGTHVFTPCFDVVDASSSVYAINKYDQSNSYPEGSAFIPNYSDVKPFEAYIAVPSSGVAPRYIPIRDDDETGIMELQNDEIMELQNGTYDLTGRKVQGELRHGVYIIDGKKVMVK